MAPDLIWIFLKGCLQNKISKDFDIKDIPKAMSTAISMDMLETVLSSLFLKYTYYMLDSVYLEQHSLFQCPMEKIGRVEAIWL